jgi:hypothetical protein
VRWNAVPAKCEAARQNLASDWADDQVPQGLTPGAIAISHSSKEVIVGDSLPAREKAPRFADGGVSRFRGESRVFRQLAEDSVAELLNAGCHVA